MENRNIFKRRYRLSGFFYFITLIFTFSTVYSKGIQIVYPRFGINAVRKSNDTLTVRFNLPPDSFMILNKRFKSQWYRANDSSSIYISIKKFNKGVYNIEYVKNGIRKTERHSLIIKNHNNYENYLRLIFITDTHIGYRHTKSKLARWINIINRENPDLVIFGGDNIEYQNGEFMQEFMDLANKINAPLYIIPGNHEHHNIFKFPMDDILFKKKIESFDHFHFSDYPISVYLMDSRNDNLPIPSRCKGPLKSTILWADTLLRTDTMPFKMFVMHGPPRDPSEHNQQNNDLVMSVAKKNNVNFILCGHTHVNAIYDNDMHKYDKIEAAHEPLVVQTGTACKTFLPLAVIREMDFYFSGDSLNDKFIYLRKK